MNQHSASGSNEEHEPSEEIQPPYLPYIIETGHQIATLRQRPLLAMYYDDNNGEIIRPDIRVVYEKLEKYNWNSIPELDILLHTRGGHPNTAYLIVQTIRKFAHRINFLIPHHAYSGGTLMTLGGDSILMGPFASLGPIDLQLGSGNGTLPVIDIDKYIDFVKHTTDKFIRDRNLGNEFMSPDGIAKTLLKELTEELRPTQIGHLFRLRTLSEYYARVLLSDYMFKYDEDRINKVERIVARLNHQYPDHAFDIDFHIAEGLGLCVDLMDKYLFHLSDNFLSLCASSKARGEICPFLPRYKCESEQDFRIPFFEVFRPKDSSTKGGVK